MARLAASLLMRDEDIAGVIEYMKAEVDDWCATDLPTPRAASARSVEAVLRKAGLTDGTDGTDGSVARFASPARTFQEALKRASANDRIVIFRSFYTAAGVMAYRESQQH